MKKLKEEQLLHTPVFTVVRKEFEDVNFSPVGLNCNDWVMVIVVDKNFKTLVVKQTRWGLEDKTIEFPCGTVEANEPPVTAAIRELMEETGIERVDTTALREIACFNPNPAYFNNKMHIYRYDIDKMPEKFGEQKLDEHEDCEPFVVNLGPSLYKQLSTHAMGLAAIGAITMSGLVEVR